MGGWVGLIHLCWFAEKGVSVAKHFNACARFVGFTDYAKTKVWSVLVRHAHLQTRALWSKK